MTHTIFAEKVFTGDAVLDNQVISCVDGKIADLSAGNAGDTNVKYISAGFFDTHINGGELLYFASTPDVNCVGDIALSSKALGTAYTLPTMITSPLENIFAGIDAVKKYMSSHPAEGVVGMHLEGPFLHPVKRGAHLTEFLQKPTDAVLKELIKYGRGVIKLMTIAPELFTEEQVEMLMDSGIVISAGHSNATYGEAQSMFKRGIPVVTHLYNAMSGFSHRAPGLIGATFDNDDVYAPIILDGAHCDFAAARIAYKIKRDKLFLISDALFTGDKIKNFKWGNYDARLQDGKYLNSEGNLTGSAICMGDAVRNAVNEVDIPLQEAVEMATARPARALRLDAQMGYVKKGYPAVFTAFTPQLDSFAVMRG
jgi:N-acetylglucosamine-6-phosphate deacetylase